MRLWSLHPRYLDTKGLVALWREALLAKHVLEGRTKGYKHHPQLIRFKASPDPVACINYYLSMVFEEAKSRGYQFDRTKFSTVSVDIRLTVTRGQIDFETGHLIAKLKKRDQSRYEMIKSLQLLEANPLFRIIEGDTEEWEITG
jgi:hypothetical protein